MSTCLRPFSAGSPSSTPFLVLALSKAETSASPLRQQATPGQERAFTMLGGTPTPHFFRFKLNSASEELHITVFRQFSSVGSWVFEAFFGGSVC